MNEPCECMICKNNKKFDMPEEIVESVLKNNLVLFCGAGISTESKFVFPESFYTNVLREIEDKTNKKVDLDISFSRLMSLYVDTFPNGRRKLLNKIKEKFDFIDSFPQLLNIATSFHKEVAANPFIETIITTNWDTYFEDYCDCTPVINDTDATLWNVFKKRVFKIHGSIHNVGSIVATEKDYQESYNRLSKDLIGDRLKTILASNTVVFIGFSFGDEDLNRLLDILSEKMGDFSNQFYLVTIDEKWKENADSRLIPIITDGTYFIHQLNNILIAEGRLVSSDIYDYAEELLYFIKEEHMKFFESNTYRDEIKAFPELLLSIAYQDAFIHALERCVANRSNGEYLIPGYFEPRIQSYKSYYDKRILEENYAQAFYNLGYCDGLLSLLLYANDPEEAGIPGLFIYEENYFETKDDLFKYISENRNKKQFEYCSDKVQNMNDVVPHFMPWFI